MAEVANTTSSRYENYNVSASKGSLYQSSKVAKEGFEKVETKNGDTYHRYVRAVTGFLTKVDVVTANFPSGSVEQIVVNITDKKNKVIQVIQAPLFNSKGFYSSTAISLLNVLPNVDKNEEISLSVYLREYTTKNGDKRNNLNVGITYLNKQNSEGKQEYAKWIDLKEVPMGVKEEKRGTTTWNFDERDEFYFKILEKVKEDFKYEPETQYSSNKSESVKQEALVEDDLPF